MENFRLIVIGISCITLLITIVLIQLTSIDASMLLKIQANTAMIMICAIVLHFLLEEKNSKNNSQ